MVFRVESRQKNAELLILMTAGLFALVVMCLILPWISCLVCVQTHTFGFWGLIFFYGTPCQYRWSGQTEFQISTYGAENQLSLRNCRKTF
jgi:hypothetical protein